MERAPDLEILALSLTRQISEHQQAICDLAAERGQVYLTLQRSGYSTREIARVVGTSQPAVVEAMKRPYIGGAHAS